MTSRGWRFDSAVRLFACLVAGVALAPMNPPALALGQDRGASGDAGVLGAIIRIDGEITMSMVDSLKRRVHEARSAGADPLVFEIDTPGGRIDAALSICDLIKNQADIKTVAWVNTNAHSAGALIAVACDEMVMARSSRIGDSQAIMGGPFGAMPIPEELLPKVLTPLLEEYDESAKLNGYSRVLCEAFVKPELEVWWLEHIETGEREFVFAEEKYDRFMPKKREWKLVEVYRDEVLGRDIDVFQPIVRDDRLLELSAGEAMAFGFSRGVATQLDDVKARYKLARVLRVDPSWLERFTGWMTSFWVRGFLLVLILLGAYVEFHTPGVGVPGLVALISLGIFVGAPYLNGLANIWEVLFIIGGVSLMALELFVIPGFGIAGISGIALLFIGLLGTFVPDEWGRAVPLFLPTMPQTMDAIRVGIITMVSSMAASLVGIVMLSRFLPRMPLFRGIVPANPTPSQVQTDDPYRGAARIGDLGVSSGPLHPAGKARFGSVLVDVVTQGGYLEADTRVEVIERRGNHVVVRPVL